MTYCSELLSFFFFNVGYEHLPRDDNFWGSFGKLWKVTIGFVTSVCLSVCRPIYPPAQNNSAAIGRILMKFDILVFLENMSEKN